jgi:ATP-binding cassette, subfamily A (ABC1), member 3
MDKKAIKEEDTFSVGSYHKN